MSKQEHELSRVLQIGVVTQYFLPEKAPIPSSVPLGLAARGNCVRVVTGFPNYPEGVLHPDYRQRFAVQEIVNELDVLRTPLFISHSASALGRIANYLSFGFSALSATRFLKKADVNYVYATQMTAAIAPMLWWKFRGTPYVLHVQDLWPDSVTGSGMLNPFVAEIVSRILSPFIRVAYKNAAAVIGITNRMTSVLIDRGAKAENTFTLYNWAPPINFAEAETVSVDSIPAPSGDIELKLMYAGNIGIMQDLGTLLSAMDEVRDLPIRLNIFGNGVQESEMRSKTKMLDLSNIDFFGSISASEIREQYQKHDFQVILLKKLPLFEATIPSKFQSGISCGLPLIAAVDGELADLTAQYEIGFVAEPESPLDLADAIRAALALSRTQRSEMRTNSIKLYQDRMSYESGMERLEEILQYAVRKRRKGKFL